MARPQRITPFLWFDTRAEEAANYYASIFDDSRVGTIARYDKAAAQASGMPEGTAMTVAFELDGSPFVALNGGPHFKFTEAVSFVVNCESQAEIDHYWNHLSAGGDPAAQQCGWLKDKFGLSWQVVPVELPQLIQHPRAMQAMLQMKKIDLDALRKAAAA
ncbi:putative 3-demethylubiquinone-9 3-methyltransferase (glyoxalase superfamily) [Lysobacter niabensis]|uniref:3-demethylubiquinone-9 3-methyltransferase (Glyoxalase superfamily) n=1 Tax=Agrilutibacter niabensis TaxID=380628 RepID=A0ABU1VLT1_9GAMM|nr:VOC family protein [Lysobacter niabensis]MDR7098440.1 putative 3-demethylubiquinone-9 3-methyltransferase (glyoxalase superfamily) [Lysobacter niabensis]